MMPILPLPGGATASAAKRVAPTKCHIDCHTPDPPLAAELRSRSAERAESRGVRVWGGLVAGAGFEPATFGL